MRQAAMAATAITTAPMPTPMPILAASPRPPLGFSSAAGGSEVAAAEAADVVPVASLVAAVVVDVVDVVNVADVDDEAVDIADDVDVSGSVVLDDEGVCVELSDVDVDVGAGGVSVLVAAAGGCEVVWAGSAASGAAAVAQG
jgi:hypothetical protein